MRKEAQQAISLYHSGRAVEAEKCCKEYLKKYPNDVNLLNLAGGIAIENNQLQDALYYLSRAAEQAPDNSTLQHNLGYLHIAQGQFAAAEGYFRKAIQLRPCYGEASQNLSGCRKFTDPNDPVFKNLLADLEKKEVVKHDRCYMHFAAGKIYDDLKEYDKAFYHYKQGNEARGQQFDCLAFKKTIDDIIEVYTAEFVQQHLSLDPTQKGPIFIVGMPRSGSTLVERVIAGHPQVFPIGESPLIPTLITSLPQNVQPKGVPFPACVSTISASTWNGFRQFYQQHANRVATQEFTHFVDKNLANYRYLGFILALFPGARIIHTLRNPMDTALSCYMQNFTKSQEYAFNLSHIAFVYQQYQRLMNHWKRVLPGKIIEVPYEEMIKDQEVWARKLIKAIGLKWDDACLEPEKTDSGKVITASVWQVRQPVYKTSVERWRRYEKHLKPLIDAFQLNKEGKKVEVKQLHEINNLLGEKKYVEAEKRLEELLQEYPSDAELLNIAAACALQQQKLDEAEPYLAQALTLDENNPCGLHNYGYILASHGHFDEAETYFRKAIALKPDYASAYLQLAESKKFKEKDPIVPQMEALLARNNVPTHDKPFYHFALGKIYNDLQQYELAFKHYQQGNNERHHVFDPKATEAYFARLKKVYNKEFCAQIKPITISPSPIFIVGMPRSGSTLFEQLLLQHPQITSGGELYEIRGIAQSFPRNYPKAGKTFPECMVDMPNFVLEGAAIVYINRLRDFAKYGAGRVLDKNLQNFEFLGMIHQLFKNPKVIHITRDPIAVCLSCYMQNFNHGQEYSFDLKNLAFYYKQYQDLMAHWEKVLPITILQISYEELINANQETMTKVWRYLNLPESEVGTKENRAILTASRWQARQPLYRDSLEKWRHYEPYLGGALDDLRQ